VIDVEPARLAAQVILEVDIELRDRYVEALKAGHFGWADYLRAARSHLWGCQAGLRHGTITAKREEVPA